MAKWKYVGSEERIYNAPGVGRVSTGDVVECDEAPDSLWESADSPDAQLTLSLEED